MRERFKGTGSLKNFGDTVEKVEKGLTEEKKAVLDLWEPDEMDEHDREALFERYSISKEDLDIYYGRIPDEPKYKFPDNEEIKRLREKTSIAGNTDENQNSLDKKTLTTNMGSGERSKVSEVFETTALGMMASGLSNIGKSNKIKNNGLISGDMKEQTLSAEFVQYHVNDMDLIISKEKADTKDIKMNIQKKSGQHDVMDMSFNIKTEEIDKYVNLVCSKDTTIEIALNRVSKVTGEDDFKRIFNGIIERGEVIRTKGELSKVTLTAYSSSLLTDRIKHYRIFQDINMTRKQVLEIIMEEHTEKDKIQSYYDSRLDQPIGRIYVQFGMTNWEFVNYMLSTFEEKGMSVTAHLNTIIFGYINVTEYTSNIDNAVFTRKREGENLLYRVIGTDPYSPGELLSLVMPYEDEYEPRRVYSSRFWVENDLINCDFESIDEEEYIFPLFGNKTITGKAVEAKVVEVGGVDGIATVTLDFTDGFARMINRGSVYHEDEGGEKWQFPYTSMYSQSNTGFFVAPEPGDVISVYFPNENETLAYVQGAVNNPGNARASNPNVRNYTLGGDESAGGKPMFDFQLSSKDFGIKTTNSIILGTKNKMSLSSSEKIIMNSNEKIVITNGTSLEQAKEINISSSSDTSIVSNGKATVVSSEDMTVGSTGTTNIGGGTFTHVKGAKARIN